MFYNSSERDELKHEHIEMFRSWQEKITKFSMIPDHLILTDKISEGERVFLFKLFALSDKFEGTLYHSNDKLAEELGCGVSNVKKYLDSLKKKKLIMTLSTGPNSPRVICLRPWIML
ncbi:hypothetical protein [Microcystis phage MaeS]|nr:hypothetical protein [Microcystis phage MaeS]